MSKGGDYMKYEIGTRIRKYREEQNMSQKQLAEKIGVSNSRVSNWEQGINRPDADMIAEICETLNVSPSLLLGVHLDTDEFNEHEKKIIKAYREKTDLQKAINILLEIHNE